MAKNFRRFCVLALVFGSMALGAASPVTAETGSASAGAVLVAPPGIDPKLGALAHGFSAWLELRIAGAGLSTTPRAAVLAHAPSRRSDALSPLQMLELGRELGARYVVFPNLRFASGQVEARLRVIETASKRLVAATRASAPLATVGDACERAAFNALEGMGVATRSGPAPRLEELAASGRALSRLEQGRLYAAWREVEGKLSTTTVSVRAEIVRAAGVSKLGVGERARVLAAAGDASRAWALIQRDLKRGVADPKKNSTLLIAAVEIQLARSNPREARRYVELLLESGVTGAETQRLYARVLIEQRDEIGARRALERAIRDDPNDPWSYERLAALTSADTKRRARWLLEAGRREAARLNAHRARSLLDRAEKSDPTFAASSWRSRGELDQTLGRPVESLTAFRRAVEIDGPDAESLSGIGNAHRALGDLKSAETAFNEALALEPNYAQALHGLGVTQLDSNRADEAVAVLERAVKADRGNREPRRNLAQALRATGNLTRALEHLKLQSSTGGRPSVEDLRLAAEIHTELGQHEQARDSLVDAARLEPFDPDVQDQLAAAYSASGDEASAARARQFTALLRKGPGTSIPPAPTAYEADARLGDASGPDFDAIVASFASQMKNPNQRRVVRLEIRDVATWRGRLYAWLRPRAPDVDAISASLDRAISRTFDLAPTQEIANPILADQIALLYDFEAKHSLDADLIARTTQALEANAIFVTRIDWAPEPEDGGDTASACGDGSDRFDVEIRMLSGQHPDVVTILASSQCVAAGFSEHGVWNQRAVTAYGLLVALLFFPLFRGWGKIEVTIKLPPKTKGFFAIRVSKNADDVPTQNSKVSDSGRLKKSLRSFSGLERSMVGRETLFRWIPARKRSYHVTVKGPLMDASGENIIGHFLETQKVRVPRGRLMELEYDFRPVESAVEIQIRNGEALVNNARIALRGQPDSLRYARTGSTIIPLGQGSHHLLVGAGDRVAEYTLNIESLGRSVQLLAQLTDESSLVFKDCAEAVEPFLNGDYLTAADALDAAGQSHEAHVVRATYHQQIGAIDEAVAELEAAGRFEEAAQLRAVGDDAVGSAALYEKAGDPGRAAEAYRTAGEMAEAARCFEAAYDYYNALECYREVGDDARALEVLEKTGEFFEAACLAGELGDSDRALTNFQQVDSRDPSYGEACKRMADALEARGDIDLAAEKAGEAIEVAGGKADVALHERHGELLSKAGLCDRAIDAFETVRRIEPQRRDITERIAELARRNEANNPEATEAASRYEILGELGRGAMGVVYKARDKNLGRVVALKRLPDSMKDHPTAVALFKREAQAAAALNHRNIVTLFDAGEENGVYFITMELLDGMPLNQILKKRKRLSVADTARIGIQIAAGLQYAKVHHIVHRDIKSGNLFFTNDRTVKIMDFGLAKTIEEVRKSSTMIGGTPNFMAPEQAAGGEVDHRADLYAFGVTLYQLVTGTVPFEEGDLAYHHRHTTPADPRTRTDGIPPELAELILRMLAKAPGDRPADAAEIARALEAILEAAKAPK